MKYISGRIQQGLQENLDDWCKGGPSAGGWTRYGPPMTLRKVRLVGYSCEDLDIDCVLSKNPDEVKKWHIDFLQNHHDWTHTAYWTEYLRPRYDEEESRKRASDFLTLFADIATNGIRRSINVADIGGLGLGFKFFRFDGCHRAACAKFLGQTKIRAFLFTVEALNVLS